MQNKSLSLEKLKVVAFDWDNTLAFTRNALVCTVNQILRQYGLPDWDEVKKKRNPNLSFRDNFPIIFGDRADEAYEKYRACYKQNIAKLISVPEKAKETVQFLRSKGVKTVIVSNKDRLLLEYELPLVYDFELFDDIVCGHEAQKDKPNPEQLVFGVKNIVNNISTDSVWMIGDSPMDSCCAIEAGAKAIRIGQPIWDNEKECRVEEVFFFSDFSAFYVDLTEV